MSIKGFFIKQMLKKQLKNLPEKEQEKIIKMVEENPDLFAEIAKEVDQKVKGGMGQMEASITVMKKHREKLSELMQK